MWMFAIELSDGTRVHAYKHRTTRRYFHLGEDGRAFAYIPRYSYLEVGPAEAIDEAFHEWDELYPEPDADALESLELVRRRVSSVGGAASESSIDVHGLHSVLKMSVSLGRLRRAAIDGEHRLGRCGTLRRRRQVARRDLDATPARTSSVATTYAGWAGYWPDASRARSPSR